MINRRIKDYYEKSFIIFKMIDGQREGHFRKILDYE